MTTEQAVDILIKRGSQNDEEDEALEKLVCKAKAFDYIREKLGIRCYNGVGFSVRIHVKPHDGDLVVPGYDMRLTWELKEAFKEDDE